MSIELAGLKIEQALGPMRAGRRFRRKGWPPSSAWVSAAVSGAAVMVGDGKTATQGFYRAHFAMRSLTGGVLPWAPSIEDMAAEDWEEV